MSTSRPRDIRGGLRPALDALPDVVYVMTASGELRFLGAPARKLYGRSLSELRAAGDFRLVGLDEPERERVAAIYARLRDRKRAELRYTIQRPDGTRTRVCERLSRRDGFVQGVIAAARAREDVALPHALRAAVDVGDALFGVVDFKGTLRWLSASHRELLGIDPRGLIGKPYHLLLHPEDRAGAQAEDARRVEQPQSARRVDIRLRTGDGGWKWFACVAMSDPSRERTYTVAVDIDAGKRAEQNVKKAREVAAVARAATYDGLWDVDLVTGEITCNARLYAMLGYAEREIEFRYDNWMRVVHPDDRERVAAAFENHLWGDAPMYHLEHRLLRRDGSVCWVLARGQVVTRQGGFNPLRMIGSYTDVTERRLVEEALARSEERARCIVEAVTVPMVITALADGVVVFANPHAVELFGRRTEPEAGDFYAGLDDRAGLLAHLEADGHVAQREMALTDGDGAPCFVITSASLIEFDGEPAVLATFSDITERRRAEEALRERNETLDLILRTTSDGIWDWDLRTDEVRYSTRWREMLGYGATELAEHADTWRALIHPEDRPLAEQRLRDHLKLGIPFEHTSRYRHRDGSLRTMLVRGHAMRDADGHPWRIVGNHTDITDQMRARDERRRIEARLQDTHRLESMGVMAKGVAHDFNNLMMAILGNAELALLDLGEHGEAAQTLAEISAAARRASELCNQLLAYAGEGDLRLSPLHVGDLVSDIRQLLEATISRKAHIELDCDADLPAIRGDAARLRQVVANLVHNASDALGGLPGNIRIATGLVDPSVDAGRGAAVDPLPDGLYVYVDVIDDGAGIDPEIVPRIFDPFFTTRPGSGRGLGLATALGIMRGHGGTIEVESEPGAGSRFRLLLPSVSEAARVGPSRSSAEVPAPSVRDFVGEGRLLFVDDEESIRDLGARVLGRVGFQVEVAVDGREAVAQFRRARESLRAVVLDLTMPELDGEEVYRILRELRADVPILLMSGFPEHDAFHKLPGDERVDFLQKPFTHAQLIGSLARLLG